MRNKANISVSIKISIDLLLLAISLVCSYWIHYDQGIPARYFNDFARLLSFIVITRFIVICFVCGYQPAWRYVSLHDARLITGSTFLSSALIYAGTYFLYPGFSRGVLAIDTLLNLFLLLGARLLVRTAYPVYMIKKGAPPVDYLTPDRRLLIVGAGSAAEQVARTVRQQATYRGWKLVGFVDDDPVLQGTRIHGRPVMGTFAALPSILDKENIDEILVAIPKLVGKQLSEIIRLCENSPAHISMVPEIAQVMNGASALNKARDIRVEDLLERDPVALDMTQIQSYLTGQRILVTGAGGSIGGEICRQVSKMHPEMLIMLGRGENSIFESVAEVRAISSIDPIPVIASVQDPARMRAIFEKYRPTVVFHAAAHKHVPLMEACPTEAIANNVFGTRITSSLADEYGASKFVLISTDKAVNPKSVMGASKRLAEIVIQSKAPSSRTEFVAVRFGNVLGSRGSVVPTMQRQIQRGGPVSVTDPEMTRYFMTIPEAVQLVLQAGAMGKSGEIFVLDMGTPVRIIDLARNLIRLSGKVPGKDIAIKIIGPRPGEKLHEELMTAEEGIAATRHSRIFVTQGQSGKLSRAELTQLLSDMEKAIRNSEDNEIRYILGQVLPSMQAITDEKEPI